MAAAGSGDAAASNPLYGITVRDIMGKEHPLGEYIDGKVAVIVNVASECGFTSQYEGLQELYEKYKDRGLVVLGFPCNQFGGQEPGSDEAINTFACSRFKVSFPMFAKVDVNGDKAHPLYKYLTSTRPGIFGESIKWNFQKFLIDRKGTIVERYASTTKPTSMSKDVEKLL